MFKSKTVFIVGAGASCEADLPSGDKLKGQIASLLDIRFDDGWNQSSGDHAITHALRQVVKLPDGRQGNINPYLQKAWRIRDVVPAAAISIDNFLDAHRGDQAMELCGKLGIVRSILNAEASSKLAPPERGQDRFSLRRLAGTWYVGFFQMLTENVAKADVASVFDNVSIITFNYDRCIERFIVQALADYYELDDGHAAEIASKLRIYHPYGQVGRLPWQQMRGSVPFGAQSENLLSLAGQIKTFTEGLDDEDLVARMHGEIMEADTLVFLGFAFHPINMELLTPPDEGMVRRVFGTTYGMSKADEAEIAGDITRLLRRHALEFHEQVELQPELASVTSGEFFKQYFRSMSAPVDRKDPPIMRRRGHPLVR